MRLSRNHVRAQNFEIDNESENYLLCEEVQGLISNNNNIMTAFEKEKMDKFNEIIYLSNLISEQESSIYENRRVQEKLLKRTNDIKSKLEFQKSLLFQKYSLISKEFGKVLKEIEKIEGIRKIERKRGSADQEQIMTFVSKAFKNNPASNCMSEPNLILLDRMGSDDDERSVDYKVDEIDEEDIENQLNENSFDDSLNPYANIAVPKNQESSEKSTSKAVGLLMTPQGPSKRISVMKESEIEDLIRLHEKSKNLFRQMKDIKAAIGEANKNISHFISTLESKLNEKYTCKHCFTKYTLLDNHKDSCCYHPGKVKYFSCKKCGEDEYNTCCRVCNNCNPGCMTSSHVPLLKYSDLRKF